MVHSKFITMKKANFKIIVFTLFFFSILTSCSSQKVVYEPLGIMDKPLPTIEIVAKQQLNLNSKVFELDKKTFDLLEKYIKSKFNQNSAQVKMEYEYGTYKVIYSHGSKKIEYIAEAKEKSKEFFKGQLELVKSNQKLYKKIEELVKRLQ